MRRYQRLLINALCTLETRPKVMQLYFHLCLFFGCSAWTILLCAHMPEPFIEQLFADVAILLGRTTPCGVHILMQTKWHD
jgi:hypothetical protein